MRVQGFGHTHLTVASLLLIVIPALLIAACDTAVTPETSITNEEHDVIVFGKVDKVALCHVGNELPEYDPDCTNGCGDAGKIDLIFVPPNGADRHLDNPSHSYGGVSDYLPGDEGASGEGTEDSDGNGIDDGCEIPQETVFAIAYTDDDPDDGGGFKPGKDVLIAKWVDGPADSPDGVVGPGDVVVTNHYPLDFAASGFGNFTVQSHTIEIVYPPSPTTITGLIDRGRLLFVFNSNPDSERYEERVNTRPVIQTRISDSKIEGVGNVLRVSVGSPSEPDTPVSHPNEPGPADDAFIDVDMMLP